MPLEKQHHLHLKKMNICIVMLSIFEKRFQKQEISIKDKVLIYKKSVFYTLLLAADWSDSIYSIYKEMFSSLSRNIFIKTFAPSLYLGIGWKILSDINIIFGLVQKDFLCQESKTNLLRHLLQSLSLGTDSPTFLIPYNIPHTSEQRWSYKLYDRNYKSTHLLDLVWSLPPNLCYPRLISKLLHQVASYIFILELQNNYTGG